MVSVDSADRPGDLGTVRSREIQQLQARAKGPLAAEFEGASSTIDQLNHALHAGDSDANDNLKAMRIIADRCLTRLTEWGKDSGASSRLLDHRLRRASQLRNTTLDLLKDLHELFLKGMSSTPRNPPFEPRLTNALQRSPQPSAAWATSL